MPDETKAKKIKYKINGVRGKHFIRAWTEGRGRNGEHMVQVWYEKTEPAGEPDGDWAMPGVLPLVLAVDQAILNTKGEIDDKAKTKS